MCHPGRPAPIGASQKCSPGLGAFHRRKIARAFFFVAVVVHPRVHLHAAQIDLGKFAVVLELRDAVVDRAFALVRVGIFLQPLNQRDHAVDIVRGADPVLRRFHAQRSAVRKKRLDIFFGVLA